MIDFTRYFLPEHQVFLENVNFEMLKPVRGRRKMNCRDTIVARLSEPVGIKITFNRALLFEPEGNFYLSVTFSCFLRFRPEVHDEIDWRSADIAGEFRAGGGPVLNMLAARASLLISQITSASGQPPIVTSAYSKREGGSDSFNQNS